MTTIVHVANKFCHVIGAGFCGSWMQFEDFYDFDSIYDRSKKTSYARSLFSRGRIEAFCIQSIVASCERLRASISV